ncbi:MAG: choice-of-anchor Q domain-containing protein, partial [Pyrinomonadaceae bacterium]
MLLSVYAAAAIAVLSSVSLAAAFTVTKVEDTNDGSCSADCSLREAIAAANAAPGDDVIGFDPVVFGANARSIIITGPAIVVANNGTITINGSGRSLLNIIRNNASYIFSISAAQDNAGAHLLLKDLTLANLDPSTEGGTFWNGQQTTVTNVTVRDFRSGIGNAGVLRLNECLLTTMNGSAITSDERGTAYISNSTITNISSTAIYNGRGTVNLINSTVSNSFRGIYNYEGTVNIISSTIANNATSGFASPGGAILNFSSSSTTPARVNIVNSTISGNSSSGSNSGGGAIMNNTGQLTITGSSIVDNRAIGNGGGAIYSFFGNVRIEDSTVARNSADGSGGGIYNLAVTMDLKRVNFDGNRADADGNGSGDGGAIHNRDVSIDIHDSTFKSNTAYLGGGVYLYDGLRTANISGSTFESNEARGNGGGIYNSYTVLNLTNSTFADNNASGFSSGEGFGGAIFNSSNNTNLTNVTIVGNRAGIGGAGIRNGNLSTGEGVVRMRNSIIADNLSPVGYDFQGTLTSQGYNLIKSTFGTTVTGTTTGNKVGQDPELGALAYNGGPTKTFSLQPSSPAIDAADPSVFPAIDQRGFIRPIDGDANGSAPADIGAFERGSFVRRVPFDFDGDAKTDVAVFRPGSSAAEWWILRSGTSSVYAAQFGASTD